MLLILLMRCAVNGKVFIGGISARRDLMMKERFDVAAALDDVKHRSVFVVDAIVRHREGAQTMG